MGGSQAKTVKIAEVIAGRYQIVRLIAEGGMGVIHLANQIGLGRKVAIKTLLPHLSAQRDLTSRFRR